MSRRLFVSAAAGFLEEDVLHRIFAPLSVEISYDVEKLTHDDLLLVGSYSAAKPFLGKVGTILIYTHESRYAIGLDREQVVGGTRVIAFANHLGDFDDIWEFYVGFGRPMVHDVSWAGRKPSCMFASNHVHWHGSAPEDLTASRSKLARAGVELGLLDLYGRGWHPTPVQDEHRAGRGGSDWHEIKNSIASQYRVQFALENTYLPRYVTEKFWQATDAGSVPVYLGSPLMDEFVSAELYLDLRRLSSVDEVFDAISRTSSDGDWPERVAELQRLTATWRARADRAKVLSRWRGRVADIVSAVWAHESFIRGPWSPAPLEVLPVARPATG